MLNKLQSPNEKRGEGINKIDYWVSTDISAPDSWKMLPLITSEQMTQSKSVKYVFKGNLEEKIISSPVFNGQEKHLVLF